MTWCIVCSCWYTYKSPPGLCTGCKAREDARYVEPEIPIKRVEKRGGRKKNSCNRYTATNPIVLHLQEAGSSLREWCKENGEDRFMVTRVINRSKIHKRIQGKLEEQGLWELLNGEE